MGRPGRGAHLTGLLEGAALVGGHRWCELSVWELLGGWAAEVDAPAAAVALDVHASHAAWRAGQWWDRLPVLAGVDRGALTAPPSPAWAAAVGAAAATTGTAGRLAVAYRVLLPRLAAAYEAHAARTGPAGDGPVRRTLRQASADLWEDWRAGEVLLQDLLRSPALVAEAAAAASAGEAPFGHPAGEAAQ